MSGVIVILKFEWNVWRRNFKFIMVWERGERKWI